MRSVASASRSVEHRGLTLTHEPRRGARGLIAGHLHPAATVYSNGSATRRPCFVHDGKHPAAARLWVGRRIDQHPRARRSPGCSITAALEVTMLGRNRLYPVSTKRLVAGV